MNVLERLKTLIYWTIPIFVMVGLVEFATNYDFQLPTITIPFGQIVQLSSTAESIFLAILVESFPFVIAGAVLSSLIQEFVSPELLLKWMPRNVIAAVVLGALFGLVIPTCDCGTIPIARSLLRKGIAQGAAVAFTLAAPVINPVTIAATYVAFGFNLHVTLMRVGLTFAIATIIGLAVGGFSRGHGVTPAGIVEAKHDTIPQGLRTRTKPTPHETWHRLKHIADHTVVEFFGVAGFLIVSAAVASVYQVYHAQHVHFGHNSGWMAVAVMMGLAILFSLCSEADAFVARSFSLSYSQGAVLSFMLIGQMADLRNLFLLPRTFGLRTGFVVIVLCVVLVFAAGTLF